MSNVVALLEQPTANQIPLYIAGKLGVPFLVGTIQIGPGFRLWGDKSGLVQANKYVARSEFRDSAQEFWTHSAAKYWLEIVGAVQLNREQSLAD